MSDVKDHIMSLLKIDDYSKPKCVKTTYGNETKPNKLKIEKQSEEDKLIKNIRNLFKLKKENEPFLNKKMVIINQQQ